jgi:hypothetical protein
MVLYFLPVQFPPCAVWTIHYLALLKCIGLSWVCNVKYSTTYSMTLGPKANSHPGSASHPRTHVEMMLQCWTVMITLGPAQQKHWIFPYISGVSWSGNWVGLHRSNKISTWVLWALAHWWLPPIWVLCALPHCWTFGAGGLRSDHLVWEDQP